MPIFVNGRLDTTFYSQITLLKIIKDRGGYFEDNYVQLDNCILSLEWGNHRGCCAELNQGEGGEESCWTGWRSAQKLLLLILLFLLSTSSGWFQSWDSPTQSKVVCWCFLLAPEVIRQSAKLLSIRSTLCLLWRICKIKNTLESNLQDNWHWYITQIKSLVVKLSSSWRHNLRNQNQNHMSKGHFCWERAYAFIQE